VTRDLFDSGVPDSEAHRDYLALRDSQTKNTRMAREWLHPMWEEFDRRGLADRAFLAEFARRPLHRWWEMHLGCALLASGVDLRRDEEAPDFWAPLDGRRVWYEAKVVEEGVTAAAVPDIIYDLRARDVPIDQVRLRIRQAVLEKRKKRDAHVRSGVIGPDDSYVLALNLKGTHYAHMGEPSLLVRTMFGVQPLWVVDPQSETYGVAYADESTIPYRTTRGKWATHKFKPFRDPAYRWLAYVVGSHGDPWNVPEPLWADFEVARHPFATPLPPQMVPRGVEQAADEPQVNSLKLT